MKLPGQVIPRRPAIGVFLPAKRPQRPGRFRTKTLGIVGIHSGRNALVREQTSARFDQPST
jgi:hypothetical protein